MKMNRSCGLIEGKTATCVANTDGQTVDGTDVLARVLERVVPDRGRVRGRVPVRVRGRVHDRVRVRGRVPDRVLVRDRALVLRPSSHCCCVSGPRRAAGSEK